MKKTMVIVQCRFKSKRLPGKALYPVCGVPTVVFLLRRLKCGLPEKSYMVALATTTAASDDVIEAWGLSEGVSVIRGEEEDVLKRYVECLNKYPAPLVVRTTADNPLTCPEIIKGAVEEMKKSGADYVQSEGHPYGVNVDLFTADLLKTLNKEAAKPEEREHINLYVLNHPERFKIRKFSVTGGVARSDLRVTVDTKEEWERISALFKPEDREPWRIPLAEAVKRMDSSAV